MRWKIFFSQQSKSIISSISFLIIVLGFVPPLLYIIFPAQDDFNVLHFSFDVLGNVFKFFSDFFFLFIAFRIFIISEKAVDEFIGTTLFQRCKYGLICLAVIMFLRESFMIEGIIYHYNYRIFHYPANPQSVTSFIFDYHSAEIVIYLLPYLFLAQGIKLNFKASLKSSSSNEIRPHRVPTPE